MSKIKKYYFNTLLKKKKNLPTKQTPPPSKTFLKTLTNYGVVIEGEGNHHKRRLRE
jgi:hypothetical protein